MHSSLGDNGIDVVWVRTEETHSHETFVKLSSHPNPYVRAAVAGRNDCPTEILAQYRSEKNPGALASAVGNLNAPEELVLFGFLSSDWPSRLAACSNPKLPMEEVPKHFGRLGWADKLALANNPSTTDEVLRLIAAMERNWVDTGKEKLDFNAEPRAIARKRLGLPPYESSRGTTNE